MNTNKKIKTWHVVFLIVIFLCYVGLKIWQWRWPEAMVELRGEQLKVLVADTPAHQYKGLGNRESLGEYDGMLFIFSQKKKAGFVMRAMNFPIDIVWLDAGQVVDFAPNVPLELGVKEQNLKVYYPRLEANAVLELPAGWAEKNGLKIGDEMHLSGVPN